jgi:hypothetical protein
MPRLQTRRLFLCQSAALAAGVYGTRAFSNTGVQNPTDKTTGLNGGATSADLSTAAIISAGLLGHLREVVCWTDVRSPASDLASGLRAFRNRGCQLLAGPLFALGLENPATVYATGTPVNDSAFPQAMAVRYEFPVRGEHAGVVLTWYDGEWAPPYESVDGIELGASGALYLGQHGQLLEDGTTGRRVLLCDGEPLRELTAAAHRPAAISWESAEQIERVNSAVAAGIASYRVRKRLVWDGATGCARNCPEANALMRQAGGVCA